jgi:hypothetical protein
MENAGFVVAGLALVAGLGWYILARGATRRSERLEQVDGKAARRAEEMRAEAEARTQYGNFGGGTFGGGGFGG